MTPQEVRSEIERLVNAMIQAKLAIDVNLPVLRRDGSDVLVTWPAYAGGALSDNQSGSIQEYRRMVLNRQYTCALIDGALIQISFTFRNAQLIGNRLCYYPCPLVFEQDDWDPSEIPLLDLFDDILVEEFDDVLESIAEPELRSTLARLRMRGPIRFEYAPGQQTSAHPASHAHIGEGDVRIPVFGPLSIGHFLRFVVRHYYPGIWLRANDFREWPQISGKRCITTDEQEGLFVECRPRRSLRFW
jgi:hypothetical protein